MRGPLSESCLDNKPANTHRQGFILTSCPRVFPRKEISNPTGQIRAQWSARHCQMFGLVIRCCRTTPPSPSTQQLKPHLWSPEQCGLEAATQQGLHGPWGPRCHLQQLGLTVHWASLPTTWRIIRKKTTLATRPSQGCKKEGAEATKPPEAVAAQLIRQTFATLYWSKQVTRLAQMQGVEK